MRIYKSILMIQFLISVAVAQLSFAIQEEDAFDFRVSLDDQEIEYKVRDFHGHEQFDFQWNDVACKIVSPATPTKGSPWVWRARFWGHEPQFDKAMLDKGWFVCYCDVSNLFGNDRAIDRWNKFYELAQNLKLGPRPFLEGMSRGGLIVTRWAAANPTKVSGIYADNAVFDYRSWPGGKGVGIGAPREWQRYLDAYKISELESETFSKGPLDLLEDIAEESVPVLLLINEADRVVPPSENSDLFVAKYKELGGQVLEIRREGLGHHPHSLKDPTVLVDFALEALNSEKATREPRISVSRIWDESPHNAFTDIIRWNEKFYCTFRTGQRHVHGDNGKIQVIVSNDGNEWASVAHIAEEGIDLRDPKLSITPDGRLMLLFGGSNYQNRKLVDRATRVAFLNPGESKFSAITPVNIDPSIQSENDWLWRVTWHDGNGYGVVYQPKGFHLVKTTDGVNYEKLTTFELQGRPNESTIRIGDDEKMRIVIRNEETGSGHLIVGDAPYEHFTQHTIPIRLGGPDLLQLPSGGWILGTRQYSSPTRTIIGKLGEQGSFVKVHELPSAGDTSYPGMLVFEDELWVSYYASHEEKTSIYLARVPLNGFEQNSPNTSAASPASKSESKSK